MSFSVFGRVEGVKPADEKYQAMIEVVKNMRKLDIRIPNEILEYFGVDDEYDIDINVNGVAIYIGNQDYVHYSEGDRYENIYTIDISKIPTDFKEIRLIYGGC